MGDPRSVTDLGGVSPQEYPVSEEEEAGHMGYSELVMSSSLRPISSPILPADIVREENNSQDKSPQ